MRNRTQSPSATHSRRRSNLAPRFDSLESRQLMAVGLSESPLKFAATEGNLIDIAPASDGSVWITTQKQNGYYSYGRDGVFSVDANGNATLVTGSQSLESPTSVVQGPDGAMWVASGSNTNGGRVTKFNDGVTTSYNLPGIPTGIAFDAAGKLWATVSIYASTGNVGEIIRLDPSSTWMDTYPIPSKPAVPGGITRGPDGSTMWFSDGVGSDKIGKITTRGVITEYNAGGDVGELTTGTDGNIWYAATLTNGQAFVSKITPDGTVTTDSLAKTSHISSVTTGPDGNIWFSDSAKSQFGRIDATGQMTFFPDPTRTHDYTQKLAPDGAGNLVYYKQGTGKFGHIALGLSDPGIVVTATAIDGTEGALSGLTVAKFTTTNPTATGADFQAYIDVGDAQTYAATVVSDGKGGFLVAGLPDTQAIVGTRLVTVTVESGTQHVVGDRSIALGVGVFHDAPLTFAAHSAKSWATFATDMTLGTLNDAGPSSGYTTQTVDWGDGTSSAVSLNGPIQDAQGYHYNVVGTHNYATPGDYTATLTLGDAGSTITAKESIHVAANPLQGVPVYANLGTVAQTYHVGYLVKSAVNGYDSYAAGWSQPHVDWGDGTWSYGSYVSNNDLGVLIDGSHNYTTAGQYTVTVTVYPRYYDTNLPTRSFTTTATAEAQSLFIRGNPYAYYYGYNASPSVTVGQPLAGDVEALREPNNNNNPADYTISVDWGDGSNQTVAAKTASTPSWSDAITPYGTTANYLSITAPHVYDSTGYKVVTTTITSKGRPAEKYVNIVQVTAGAVNLTGTTVGTSQGHNTQLTLASFTPAEPTDTASDYSATFTIPDGISFTGYNNPEVKANGSGGFDVLYSPLFNSWGTVPFTVTVQRHYLGGVTTSGTILVTPVSVTTTNGLAIVASTNKAFSGNVATFRVDGSYSDVSYYGATIHWGDGTASDGVIANDPSGGYDVVGNHIYSTAATLPVSVTVNNVGGVSATSIAAVIHTTATVTAPPPTTLYPHGFTLAGVFGKAFQGVVASFGDSQPGSVGDYAATIDWGDGSTSAGVVSSYQDSYVIYGSHVYTTAGVHPYGVIVQKGDETPATSSGLINVTKPIVGSPGSGGTTGGGPSMAIVSTKTIKKTKGAIQIVVTLSGTIDASIASNPNHFVVTDAGKDGKFGTKDDHVDKISMLKYDSKSKTVTLTPKGSFTRVPAFRVTMK